MNKQQIKDALKSFFIQNGFDTSGDVRVHIDSQGNINYQGHAKKLSEADAALQRLNDPYPLQKDVEKIVKDLKLDENKDG